MNNSNLNKNKKVDRIFKMKKRIIPILLAIILAILMVSCGEEKSGLEGITLETIENLSEYVVVRSDYTLSKDEIKCATTLRAAIEDSTGVPVGIKTDYDNNTFEILVGNTNRQQSIDAAEGLRYFDYIIKRDGDKIVIVGGSDEALAAAVELFTMEFIDSEKKTVSVPAGDGFIHKEEYAYDKITVDGVDIASFTINNNSFEDSDAFAASLSKMIGAKIGDSGQYNKDRHYIILDGTELIADKYSISLEDGNIVIKGSTRSLPTAMETFLGSYLSEHGSKTVDLTSADNFEGSIGKKETYTKDQLMTVIEQVYDDPNKIIIGEEVQGKQATAIGDSINKIKDVTGEMPGIMGIDLACYGIDLMNADDKLVSSYICDIVDYVSGGGILTISAHWDNPSDPAKRVRGNFGTENTKENYEKNFTDLITEGTEYNEFFKKELAVNARFLKALEENGVPVIWRPLHEANGGWFWFCTTQQNITVDSKYLVDVWHYIYDYFTNECGLTNLLWCYSPNVSSNVEDTPGTLMSTTYLYPGDDYCDMVGVDWYSSGKLEITNKDNYLLLTDLAKKPGAITEFGPAGSILAETIEKQPELYDCMDLYEDLLELSKKDYSFVYLLTWGGKWGIPAMGRGDEMMRTDLCIGQAEVKAMLDALKK